MKNNLLLLILIPLLLFAGCDADAPANQPTPESTSQPTASPPPTAVPTDTPAPTSTPDPLVQGTDGHPWWNDTVFYEVFVRSFYDSDGDGVGDINGLIEKLDYLNDGDPATDEDLGVTGIWLMPVMQSPSYHGYDVVDYDAVDDEYGTQEDFRRLIAVAHERGIRVVVDLVLNHTSREHPWFEASRDPASEMRDWYIWAEEDPGWRGPDGQKVWHRTADGYYYAVFWEGMPDLNLENPKVTAALHDAAHFWLEEMGADGFRLDAIKHLIERGELQENTSASHEWLQSFYTFYKDVDPEAFAVGEAWTSTSQVLKYTGTEVDIAFQFDLALAILNSADSRFANQIAREQAFVLDNFPPGQYATFLTNHDQNRVMSRLEEDANKAKTAASWLLTSPGVPFIYYGEEIGMIGVKPDEDIRRPMQWCSDDGLSVCFTTGKPWRFPAADYESRSVAVQESDPGSLLNHYRRLIHLRHEHEALRIGATTLVESEAASVYAFLRHSDDETVLVLINFGDESERDYALTLAEGPLSGGETAVSLFGAGDPAPPTVNDDGGFDGYQPLAELPAFSTHVIQLKP